MLKKQQKEGVQQYTFRELPYPFGFLIITHNALFVKVLRRIE